jgi:RNA recognition motif-containing protein
MLEHFDLSQFESFANELLFLIRSPCAADSELSAVDSPTPSTASYTQSPQFNVYGVPIITRASSGTRTYSFEETMLPPSAVADHPSTHISSGSLVIDPHHPANPAYSPYGTASSQGSNPGPSVGNTGIFTTHQPPTAVWGYPPGSIPEMYNTQPQSALQPRPSSGATLHHHMTHPGGTTHHIGGVSAAAGYPMHLQPTHPHLQASLASSARDMYGQYAPTFSAATSPGPPIQTTNSNKGPDGANLFIFHIPNHFTNVDMYQLFCPFGNLLSVRIMVEKNTGRSRGFGFVSYDSPESAALAIKELNGYPVCEYFSDPDSTSCLILRLHWHMVSVSYRLLLLFCRQVGNKRLKVQHKQIRPRENSMSDSDSAFQPDGSYPMQYTSGNVPFQLPQQAGGRSLSYGSGGLSASGSGMMMGPGADMWGSAGTFDGPQAQQIRHHAHESQYQQHLVVSGADSGDDKREDGTERTTASTAVSSPESPSNNGSSKASDLHQPSASAVGPLDSLEGLHAALPDVVSPPSTTSGVE